MESELSLGLNPGGLSSLLMDWMPDSRGPLKVPRFSDIALIGPYHAENRTEPP